MEAGATARSPITDPDAAGIVDPFTKIPDELLGGIFEQAIIELESISPIPPLLLAHFLRTITIVSRRWYAVAIRVPRLWRNVVIGFESLPAKLCVRRSGALPLNITANDDDPFRATGPSLTRCLRYVRVPDRLQMLDLSLLEFRELAFLSGREWPNLKSLSLRQSSIGDCSTLRALLGHARSLQYICFSQVSCRDFFGRPELAELPQLEHIELVDTSEESARAVLRSIRAPLARRLFILLNEALPQTPSQLGMANGTWDHVTDLSFGGVVLKSQDILKILPHTPRVVSLSLFQTKRWAPESSDEFLRRLADTPPRGPSSLVPQLRTLAFYKLRFSLSALRLLVDSRVRSESAIQSIGFESINSVWYLAADFEHLRKRVELFEWTPRNMSDDDDEISDDDYWYPPST